MNWAEAFFGSIAAISAAAIIITMIRNIFNE
jgi:hypothetical protein